MEAPRARGRLNPEASCGVESIVDTLTAAIARVEPGRTRTALATGRARLRQELRR